MYVQSANSRPAYTDNEIAKLFHEKRITENKTVHEIATYYAIDEKSIEIIDSGVNNLSMKMLEIASDFLNIPYEKLTEIVKDDCDISCRGPKSEEAETLFGIVNILFNEMVMQKKLSI